MRKIANVPIPGVLYCIDEDIQKNTLLVSVAKYTFQKVSAVVYRHRQTNNYIDMIDEW